MSLSEYLTLIWVWVRMLFFILAWIAYMAALFAFTFLVLMLPYILTRLINAVGNSRVSRRDG